MWVLSCDEPSIFGGKRIWLRPNSRLVLGRMRPQKKLELFYKIDIKSISRVHLVVNVAPVEEKEGVDIYKRSRITLQDSNTTFGSVVNDVKVKRMDYLLPTGVDEFKIVMGKCEFPFW